MVRTARSIGFIRGTVLGLVAGLLFSSVSEAKSKATPAPSPLRRVRVAPIYTKPFTLPNGSQVDLSHELQEILRTSITTSSDFAPYEGQSQGCDRYLELRAAVSVVELNGTQVNFRFGYSPAGDLVTGPKVDFSTEVKIGTIAMEFGVWDCDSHGCTQRLAASSNQRTSNVNLKLTLAFNLITTGFELIHNTTLGDAFRAIMVNGVKQMAASTRVPELPWQATVVGFDAATGSALLDAGTDERIKLGDTFTLFASLGQGGDQCGVYYPVAEAHAVRVDLPSSQAAVDRYLDSRGIRVGDVVMIRVR